MFSKSVSYLNDLPVNQYPRVASNAVRELVEMQAGAERPYRKNMLVYMLAAHKPTYVHSLMVANLTRFFCPAAAVEEAGGHGGHHGVRYRGSGAAARGGTLCDGL